MKVCREISRVWVKRSDGRSSYEVFQVSGSPDGVKKCYRVCIAPRGERKALAMAKAKRAEWEATTRPWGGGRPARMRVDPESVPVEMKFPGLFICRHRAIVMATRKFRAGDGYERTIYLCYPYNIEGGSLPTFAASLEQCRKGQGVLNGLPQRDLESIWKRHKAANISRKRGENMSNALLGFDSFRDGFGTKQEMSKLNHAYDRAS
ncbi:MAG: hypothetical protein V4733_03610 [Verrucomicrobiota bacterium]